MRLATITLALAFSLSSILAGCSSKGAGRDGLDGDRFGDGNIPVGGAGSGGIPELSDVNFGYDSASLSSSARASLKGNYDWLAVNTAQDVVIEGHCDERGTNEYNLALGERRAKSVESYLVTLGIPSSRISTITYGEELPLDTSGTESGWSKNRRAHFAPR